MPAKKVATAVLTSKGMLFKKPEKSPYIWATFKRNFDTKNVQKSPNLVTLIGTLDCGEELKNKTLGRIIYVKSKVRQCFNVAITSDT